MSALYTPCVLVAALLLTPTARAATIVVDRWGGGDYAAIQLAIDAAADGDTISVLPATYEESIDFSGKDVAVIATDGPESTIIDGQGLSSYTVTFANSEPSTARLEGFTVLNAGARGIEITEASPTLSDLALTALYTAYDGAGIYISGGAPSIERSSFSDNVAGDDGGHIYIDGEADVTIADCTFTGGEAERGGGVYVMGSSYDTRLTLLRSSFDANSALDTSDEYYDPAGSHVHLNGGSFTGEDNTYTGALGTAGVRAGLCVGWTYQETGSLWEDNEGYGFVAASHCESWMDPGDVTIDDATFRGNETGIGINGVSGVPLFTGSNLIVEENSFSGFSGSSYGDSALSFSEFRGNNVGAYTSATTFSDCLFEDNSPTALNGAAISGWNLTIYDSIFRNNATDQSGGAVVASGDLYVSGSLFEGNAAAEHGGAIFNDYDYNTKTIINSEFVGNSAGGHGGALYFDQRTYIEIDGALFEDNGAGGDGGAIYAASTELAISESTFRDNRASSGGAAWVDLEAIDGAYVTDSRFYSNAALTGDYGALYLSPASALDGNLFQENIAAGDYSIGHLVGAAYGLTVDRNTAIGNVAGGSDGLAVTEVLTQATGNRFCENSAAGDAAGLRLDLESDGGDSVPVKGNLFQANAGAQGAALYIESAAIVDVLNNTFVDGAGDSTVRLVGTAASFWNNIVAYNVSGAGLSADSASAADSTIYFNDWYDNDSSDVGGALVASDIVGSGNLAVAPDFVDYTGGCYDSLMLDSGSPLIDAGDPTLSDADGSRSDIGAYGGDAAFIFVVDADEDGWDSEEDCDDGDDAINPGAEDIPDDGIDQDCSGADATTADTGDTGDTGEAISDDTGGDTSDDTDAPETGDTASTSGGTGDDSDTSPTGGDDTDTPGAGDDGGGDKTGCDSGCSGTGGAPSPIWLMALLVLRYPGRRGAAR